MNLLIATVTSIILAANANGNKIKNENEKPAKVEATKKHAALDKSIRPQISTYALPTTMVEEKYIAKVTAANGDTIRYTPIFVERKIKY
jgi:hypothetical protein